MRLTRIVTALAMIIFSCHGATLAFGQKAGAAFGQNSNQPNSNTTLSDPQDSPRSGSQDSPAANFGIFQNQDEYHEFMGTVKQAGASDPEIAQLVPLLNDIVLGNAIGTTDQKYGGSNTLLEMLADPEIRAQVEMVDSQFSDLQKENQSLQREMAEQLRSLDFSDPANLRRRVNEIRSRAEAGLQASLLPHQIEKLESLLARNRLRRLSLATIITSEPLKTRLEISDTQKARLLETEKELEQELAEAIERLRAKSRQKLLAQLEREQRDAVLEIFDDFRTPEVQNKAAKKSAAKPEPRQ